MILKDVDSTSSRDKFEAAGQKAEKQLAFYLRRAFGDDPRILVLNGLRLEHKNAIAQLDHLVLHPYGWIIIESKSVTTEVSINAHQEWSRKWDGRWHGMPSPVKQVQRQMELFNSLMESVLPQFMVRRFAVFGDFKSKDFQQHMLVAISDDGRITGKVREPEVFKAEQIVDEVRECIAQARKAVKALFTLKTMMEFPEEKLKALAEFLISQHQPVQVASTHVRVTEVKTPSTTQNAANDTQPIPWVKFDRQCRHCQSKKLEMLWGRYGYYFRCKDCQQNTAVTALFAGFKEGYRVRKEGPRFYMEHEAHGSCELLHVNSDQ